MYNESLFSEATSSTEILIIGIIKPKPRSSSAELKNVIIIRYKRPLPDLCQVLDKM
jgi:hypothetical protein